MYMYKSQSIVWSTKTKNKTRNNYFIDFVWFVIG